MGSLFKFSHVGHLLARDCSIDSVLRFTLVNPCRMFRIVPETILFCLFLILSPFSFPSFSSFLQLVWFKGVTWLFLVRCKDGSWITAKRALVLVSCVGPSLLASPPFCVVIPRALSNESPACCLHQSTCRGMQHITVTTAILPPITIVVMTSILIFHVCQTLC